METYTLRTSKKHMTNLDLSQYSPTPALEAKFKKAA
jgi:hypothetical protein